MKLLFIISAIVWVTALVLLCRRRDIEIHRKISWIVAVLLLNIVGALLYFMIGPHRVRKSTIGEAAIDPDAKPIQPDGMAWNPILGENHFAAGQGLNPKEEATKEDRTVTHSKPTDAR